MDRPWKYKTTAADCYNGRDRIIMRTRISGILVLGVHTARLNLCLVPWCGEKKLQAAPVLGTRFMYSHMLLWLFSIGRSFFDAPLIWRRRRCREIRKLNSAAVYREKNRRDRFKNTEGGRTAAVRVRGPYGSGRLTRDDTNARFWRT